MMRRSVVGYVLRMFPQASETFIANEILELERRGLRVRIYSYRRPRAPVPHASLRRIQAPISFLPDPLYGHPLAFLGAARSVRRSQPSRYRDTWRYVLRHSARNRSVDTLRRFIQAVALARLVEDDGVGHLHAHFAHGATRLAMLTSMLTGVSFSFTAHARDIYSNDVDFPLLREKLDLASFAVTVSEYNRDFIRARTESVNGALRTLYNGIDLDLFCPDREGQQDEDLILGVGRLVEKKGFTHLVEACALLRDRGRSFRCEIVGGGELRKKLERQIARERLGETVRLVGPRAQEDLPALYRRAALVAMPAVAGRDGNRDALPTVLLEAMACGTPVVASRLTGIPEIVDDGETGLLVSPGQTTQLADAIDRLLRDPELRARFGCAARRKAERYFNVETNVARLHCWLLESLAAVQACSA